MNIFIWAPFLQKVGTTSNVENLINSFLKFSNKKDFKIDLINVFGEWDEYEFDDDRVNKVPLLNFNFLKENKKKGFYLYGDVGVGKTMILDFFFSQIKQKKKRLHFNEFMLNFHDFVQETKNKKEQNIISLFEKD